MFSGPPTIRKVVWLPSPPKGGELSRKQIDDYTKFVGIYGAKGLAYKVNELAKGIEGLQSPIVKFMPGNIALEIIERRRTGMVIWCSSVQTRPRS